MGIEYKTCDWHGPCSNVTVGVSPTNQGRFKTGDLGRIPREFFSRTAEFRHSINLNLRTRRLGVVAGNSACKVIDRLKRRAHLARPDSHEFEVQVMQQIIENGYPISLLIAEHSRMGCNLMETALRRCRHITVAASAVESTEFMEAYRTSNPDVCIISSGLKDGPTAGFRAARELRELSRSVSIIMLLEAAERALVIEAFRSGARGILTRDDPFELLPKCIQKVHEGQVWANSEQLKFIIESVAENSPKAITDARGATLLTNRELSLVQLVAEGRTNRDISRELHLSEHTVRNYLFRIFNKLGVSTRLELALYAINQRDTSSNSYIADS